MQPCSVGEGKKEVACFVTMVGVFQSVYAKGTAFPSILDWVMNARRTQGVQCEFEAGVWAVTIQLVPEGIRFFLL